MLWLLLHLLLLLLQLLLLLKLFMHLSFLHDRPGLTVSTNDLNQRLVYATELLA